MMLSADRVQETSSTIGTGAIALAGATLPSMNTFASAFANGALVGYVVLNQAVQTEWERGIGTYDANSIARTYVTGGSNGTSPVSFSAGTKLVMSVAPQTQQAQAYSATQVYAPGDTVTVSGVLWYALAVNLGSAPSSSNASWSQMSGQGSGVYLPLTGGTLTGPLTVQGSIAGGVSYFNGPMSATSAPFFGGLAIASNIQSPNGEADFISGNEGATGYGFNFYSRSAAGVLSLIGTINTSQASFPTTVNCTGGNGFVTSGPIGGLSFNDRTSGPVWSLYANGGVANIWNATAGNVLSLTASTGAANFVQNITCVHLTQTSDARLKTNIRRDPNRYRGIRKVVEMVLYDRTSGQSNDEAGVLAQELQKAGCHASDFVKKDDNGVLGVAYGQLALACALDPEQS